jgi:hypothetical protein
MSRELDDFVGRKLADLCAQRDRAMVERDRLLDALENALTNLDDLNAVKRTLRTAIAEAKKAKLYERH